MLIQNQKQQQHQQNYNSNRNNKNLKTVSENHCPNIVRP